MYSYFKYTFLIVLLGAWASSLSARGIQFRAVTMQQALADAKRTNKNVFVDTYATWCAPCKIMEGVFAQSDVGDYFNDQFINVRINMDGPQGASMKQQYGVVFLPTLLVISPEGEVLAKIDKLVDGPELISIVNDAQRGITYASDVSISTSATATQDYNPADKEEVVYVLDERASSGRPHIMYHEAYLHLQLQDGKHQKVVDKYLSTQDDWNTDKNVKFIFDFLQDVNSNYFRYFVEHKPRFEEVMGEEKVQRTVNILVHQRLHQGYPRPTLKEATRLYNYINPNTAVLNAYSYFLQRLEKENAELEYIKTADQYLKYTNPTDTEVMYSLITKRMRRSDAAESLTENIDLANNLLNIDPSNGQYYLIASKLYLSQGDKEEALKTLEKASQLVAPDTAEYEEIQTLKTRIAGL